MIKYPRTRHIEHSKFQNGDHDMEAVPFKEIKGRYIVVEEKMDGANAGVSFDENGELLLQSRGHYLVGGAREKHWTLFKQWAAAHQDILFDKLENQYIMYGEWLYAKHTYYYDALPHYFMEFDILDSATGIFLDTKHRAELLSSTPIVPVKVLWEGCATTLKELTKHLSRSCFITEERKENLIKTCEQLGLDPEKVLRETDMSFDMEGLYIKVEEEGVVKERYKFVRGTFLNSIMDSGTHWLNRPIVPNKLAEGVELF